MTRLTASAAALFQSFREPEFVHAEHVIPPLSLLRCRTRNDATPLYGRCILTGVLSKIFSTCMQACETRSWASKSEACATSDFCQSCPWPVLPLG